MFIHTTGHFNDLQNWLDPTREQEYRNPSPALSPPTSTSSGPTSNSHSHSHSHNPYQSYQPYPEPYHAGAMGAIGLAATPSPPPMFSALPSQSAPNLAHMGMGNHMGISPNVAAVSGGVVSNMNGGMPAYGSASLANISGRSQQQQQGQGQGQGQGQNGSGAWRAYALPGMPIPDEDVIPTAIVIKNIPFAVPRETLLGVIESLGAPLPYAFNYHHDQGVFRGLAFANFRAPDEAAAVVAALNGYDVSGRKLKVEYKKVLQPGEKDRIEREKALKRMRSVQGFDRDPGMGMGMGMGGMGMGSMGSMGSMGMGMGMGQQLSPSASYGGITPSASLGGIGLSTLGSGVSVNQHHQQQQQQQMQQQQQPQQQQMLPSGSGGLQRSSANGLSINSGIAGVSGATSPIGQQAQQYHSMQPGHSHSHPQGLSTHFEADYSPPPSASSSNSFGDGIGNGSGAGQNVNGGGGSGQSATSTHSSAAADLPTALDMNDAITLDIYSRVLLFKEDRMRDEFAFSRSLSAYERRVVHLVAARLGMTSLTRGEEGEEKYVLVLRQAPAPSSSQGQGQGQGLNGSTGSSGSAQTNNNAANVNANAKGRPGLTSSSSTSSGMDVHAPSFSHVQGPPASASAAYHSHGYSSTASQGQGQHQGQGQGQGHMLPPNELTTAALRIKKSMPDLRGFNGPVMSRDPSRSLAPQRSSGNLRAQAQAHAQNMGLGQGHGQASPYSSSPVPGQGDGYSSQAHSRESSTLSPPPGGNANAREFVSLGAAAGRRAMAAGGAPLASPGAGAGGPPGSYGAERYGWHSSSSSTSIDQINTANTANNSNTAGSAGSGTIGGRASSAAGQVQVQSSSGQSVSVAGSDVGRDGALSPVSASGSAPVNVAGEQQQEASLTRHPRGPAGESRGFVGVLGSGRQGQASGQGQAGKEVQEGEAARTRDSLDV